MWKAFFHAISKALVVDAFKRWGTRFVYLYAFSVLWLLDKGYFYYLGILLLALNSSPAVLASTNLKVTRIATLFHRRRRDFSSTCAWFCSKHRGNSHENSKEIDKFHDDDWGKAVAERSKSYVSLIYRSSWIQGLDRNMRIMHSKRMSLPLPSYASNNLPFCIHITLWSKWYNAAVDTPDPSLHIIHN